MTTETFLKWLPVLNVVGVLIYYLIIRKIDQNIASAQRIEILLTATAATLAAHTAEDLRQFDWLRTQAMRTPPA